MNKMSRKIVKKLEKEKKNSSLLYKITTLKKNLYKCN